MNSRNLLALLVLPFLMSFAPACGDEPRRVPPIVYEPEGTNNGEEPNNGTTINNGTVTNNNGTTPNNGTVPNNGTATNNGTTTNNGTSATNNGTTATNNDTTTYGDVCPNVTASTFNGECDVVRNEGCPDPELCLVALLINGPAVDVSSACLESDVHVLEENAFCANTEERCAPTMLCISTIRACKRLCYFEDGAGCRPGEWCVQPDSNWKGIGYCADSCE